MSNQKFCVDCQFSFGTGSKRHRVFCTKAANRNPVSGAITTQTLAKYARATGEICGPDGKLWAPKDAESDKGTQS